MSEGGRGVGGERDEGRNGNGEQEGEEKKGCVMTIMKCKYMEESRKKNINLSGILLNVLLDKKKKKIRSQGVISVWFLSHKKAFPDFSTDIVKSITETAQK